METARKLFPAGYGWSTMRATSDVLASVQQKLVFYVSATDSKQTEETNAVSRYEEQLIEILASQVVASDFTSSEAVEAAQMLADYESVQSDKCKAIVKSCVVVNSCNSVPRPPPARRLTDVIGVVKRKNNGKII